MNRRHAFPLGLALLSLAHTAPAQAAAPAAAPAPSEPASPSPTEARAAWAFFEGRFHIEAPPAANVPAGTVWTLMPVLGNKYLELQARAYRAEFRITLAWDSLRQQYAMSLLDSGSGVMDVYVGPLRDGELVLTNDHGFRVRIQSHDDGWTWRHEQSKDRGASWLPSGAPVRARRVPA